MNEKLELSQVLAGYTPEEIAKAQFGEGHVEKRGDNTFFVCNLTKLAIDHLKTGTFYFGIQ